MSGSLLDQIRAFCVKDPLRPYLRQPFSQGEHTIASDGHILVRVPRLPEVAEQGYPSCAKVLAAMESRRRDEMAPLPPIPEPDLAGEDCAECGGSGHEHECPDCTHECSSCFGSGAKPVLASIRVYGEPFNAKYIRMIAALPNARFTTTPEAAAPAFFVFDGGDGCVMPLNKNYRTHLGDIP